jgi:hypothetical protein
MMKNLLIMAAVALICGVIGAMGYSYYAGAKPDESSSSQSRDESASKKKSSLKPQPGNGPTESVKKPSTQASTLPSMPGFNSAEEVNELKQQIMNLSQRIDRLGERFDRLQELLGLAVPLLQRIAPKN